MNILLIDTSAKEVAVQVLGDKEVLVVDKVEQGSTSSRIMPAIEQALGEAGITVKQLDVVAAVSGPGSFTGLRIGVSVANGIAFGLGCKRLAVPALAALQEEGALAAIPSRAGYDYTLGEGYEELTTEEVSRVPSVGLEGSGAARILSKEEFYRRQAAYCLAHVEEASEALIEPLYLKKCQAERERENKA